MAALDAVRPVAGVRPAGAAQVFDTLYAIAPGSLSGALDQLSPVIYADTLMAGRLAWNAMEGTVSRRLGSLRGAGAQAGAVWVDTLGAYGGVRAGGGSPGASAGLGGIVVGYDRSVDPTLLLGVALSAAGGWAWSQTNGRADLGTGQATAYAQWQQGPWFAEAELGMVYQQSDITRPMPSFTATARGSVAGFGGGGMLRAGQRFELASWWVEPSLGFGALSLLTAGQTENGAGPLSLRTQGQSLGSLRSVVAVAVRREVSIGEATRATLRADLGWAHEYAATRASVNAGFVGLSGSGFTLSSAPVGRDTALVGLSADLRIPECPLPLFVAYSGGFANGATTQSLTAGVRMAW